MSKPVHTPFETGVTAQPVLTPKEQTQHQARNKAQQYPQPRQREIDMSKFVFHSAVTLATTVVGGFIDKKFIIIV